MNVVLAKTETGRALSGIFAIAQDRLPGTGKGADHRRQAFEAYERVGLPHRRIEDWKYTDLRVLMREVLPMAAVPDAAALTRAGMALKLHAIEGVRRLVLVDGVFAPKLSEAADLGKGLSIRTLRDVLEAGDTALHALLFAPENSDSMVALNSAMMTDGLVIEVADGVVLTQPLHIVHIASGGAPAAMFTRSLLKVGKAASATLVESYIAADGAKAYQVHDSLVVSIGDGARLDHVRLFEDGREAFNFSSVVLRLGAHAHFNTFGMTSGASVSRYQAVIAFAGEGSRVETNGVNLLNGRQHADTTLFLDHAVPNCASREIFRSVVDDRGQSVFQGRIVVRPDAQKTDAKMMTRALLLSDEAEADNKPELEIFADDVTCGHGATTGALDESLLFYLRARGLAEKGAQALLIQAFVGEAIEALANAATEAYEGGRAKVAKFLNARRNEEIVFTRNATEAINLVASSWGEPNIKAGDEIVLSIMEHHSNIVPWHFLRERHGAVIKWVAVDDEGNFLIDAFEKALTPRTKLVAITQMSNALGTIVPVKDVVKLAHARGIPVLIDGSQAAVHLAIDVQDIDCDFYVFTGHKLYGPTGIGVLYAKHEHLVAMRPYNGGGEMIREVARDWVTYGDPPHKFEAGTPAIVESIGLGAAIDYVNSIGKERIAAHEHDLLTYAQDRLREINSLRLIGTAPGKGPVISFDMKGAHPHDVATVIDRQGIAVRAGTHCVMPLLERFNVTATCRASFGMYNTREEVDHLAQALIKARELFS